MAGELGQAAAARADADRKIGVLSGRVICAARVAMPRALGVAAVAAGLAKIGLGALRAVQVHLRPPGQLMRPSKARMETSTSALDQAGVGSSATRRSIIAEMQRIAPPGQGVLDVEAVEILRALTARLLIISGPQSREEYGRFRSVAQRQLRLDANRLQEQLAGKKVLVTGGTGCIGSTLIDELIQFNPGRVVSVSRGIARPRCGAVQVEYFYVDLRHERYLKRLFQEVRPDIVYHVAAQRDPRHAEADVRHTLTTNVLGTSNVLEAAIASLTPQVVFASTGKALRPVATDTYAASKKIGEWLMADAAARGHIRCSAARFTHVVDNSIIHERLHRWITTNTPVRLHGPDIGFYVQSARESAQLLLNAGLESAAGTFTVQAIRNLEWPICLVDLTIGAIMDANAVVPIYFCGFESGYEQFPWQGLYDPLNAGEVSPLLSAFEAPQVGPSTTCPEVDQFLFELVPDATLTHHARFLERVCTEKAPDHVLHRAKDVLSWAVFDARLRALPSRVLERIACRIDSLSPRQRQPMTAEHRLINSAVCRALADRRCLC